ncbi:hypothetical protein [Sphingomonas sp. YR710]
MLGQRIEEGLAGDVSSKSNDAIVGEELSRATRV